MVIRALLSLAVIAGFTTVTPAAVRFEAASIKSASPDARVQACLCEPPGRVAYRAAPLKWVIERAFHLQASQIEGPGWLDDTTFSIDATLPRGSTPAQIPLMLRALLEDRFQLASHTEYKEMQSLVLTIAPGGSKLSAPADDWGSAWKGDRTGIHVRQRTNMDDFAEYLSTQLDRPVANTTGLAGLFAVQLDFAPENLLARPDGGDNLAPPLQTALQKQLGLKLVSTKRPVEILVIDHIGKVPVE